MLSLSKLSLALLAAVPAALATFGETVTVTVTESGSQCSASPTTTLQCNADDCLRAMRATQTPGRLAAAQSFCSTYTQGYGGAIPTYVPAKCDASRLSSACSCIATSTLPPSSMSSSMSSTSTTSSAPSSTSTSSAKYWSGWENVEKFFVFGDSYTTTGFDPAGTQPNPGNPLGNPPYPGYTSSNGPNWVDFLTVTYNESFVETYNLAYGGATVSADLVAQYLPTVLDFRAQVNQEFIPYYVDQDTAQWTSSNSLFAAFFGINDVGNSYGQQNATLNGDIFVVYSGLVEQLYQAGARNFLFLNVPPVNRSPGTLIYGTDTINLEGADIADFNARIADLAVTLSTTHPDTTVFLFDTNAIFSMVLDNPASYPQTALYKNTTAYCDGYANGTPTQDYFNATCGIPVNQYFWLNSLHPTYPMHDAVAAQVAMLLESEV
ncbi:hypothetical protein MMC24_001884 [Lignoscripta atroalba]|nr:hypothetical protein [Lignoscripta atroalba]